MGNSSSRQFLPIRYFVKRYVEGKLVEFQFEKPIGLLGVHRLEILAGKGKSILRHTIDAKASGKAKITWKWMIRPLHDALIEDAFDKVENRITNQHKKTPWSLWVKFLRRIMQ